MQYNKKIPAQLRQERGTVSGKGGPSAAPYMVLGGPYFLPWLVRGDQVFCRGRSGGTDFGGDQLLYDRFTEEEKMKNVMTRNGKICV